jgi:outer membrane immunogenic protein
MFRARVAVFALGLSALSSSYAAAQPSPFYSWTGFYLGAGVGLRSTQTDVTVTGAEGFGTNLGTTCANFSAFGGCVTSLPLNDTAFRFSPYAGFNWQVTSHWVVGIEADFGLASETTTLHGSFPSTNGIGIGAYGGNNFSVKTTWDASVRGRIGYIVTPMVLAYATGGPAWLHVEATSNCGTAGFLACGPNNFSPATLTNSTTKMGWTIGGGVEAALGYNWIARAEYRYADFGTISNTDVRAGGVNVGGGPLTVAYDLAITTHIATFGLAYKFARN